MNKRFRLKESRASGSTVAKVAKMIQLGWQPGLSVQDVLGRRSRQHSLNAGRRWRVED